MIGLELLHLHAADIGDNEVLDGGKVGFVGLGCPLVLAALLGQPVHQELRHRHGGRDQKGASRQFVFNLLLSVRCLLFGGKALPFVAALAVLIFVGVSDAVRVATFRNICHTVASLSSCPVEPRIEAVFRDADASTCPQDTELGGAVAQVVGGTLADSANIAHFSADATRYFSGEFIFMIFGLPGAALAMYQCAKPEKKKAAGGLLLSAALACMATGITEPLEFSFLFVAPALFAVQVILAGSAYMIAHMLNVAVGLTFSGGFLDFFLFGILQGNEKTSWLRVIPVGIIYFLLYYFIFKFMIRKFDFKTPGREEDDVETKLYTKADVNARKAAAGEVQASDSEDPVSEAITRGLGGKKNISDVDCCATRLRCTIHDASRVNDSILKATGASGVVHKGNGVQVIYGPNVTVIKSNLEDYLEKAPDTYAETEEAGETKQEETKNTETEKKVVKRIVISSPVTGMAADLGTAPDEAFAQKMMGDGAVVTPEEAFVCAPEDGEVAFVFDTKHAIGYMTDSGISLLIHVGIDTVKLNGEGFEVLVENGQKVKKGQPMLKLDLDYLKANAPSLATPVLCTELEDDQRIRLLKEGPVKAGEPLFEVEVLN